MIVKRGLESRHKVVEGYVTIVNRVLETHPVLWIHVTIVNRVLESTPSVVDG